MVWLARRCATARPHPSSSHAPYVDEQSIADRRQCRKLASRKVHAAWGLLLGCSRRSLPREILGALARDAQGVCKEQAVHALAVSRSTSTTYSMQADVALPPAVDVESLQHSLQRCTVARGFRETVSDTDFWCSSAMLLTRASSVPRDAAGSGSQSVQQSQWTSLRQGANRSSGSRSMTTIVPSRAFVTGVGHTTRRQKSAHYLQALRLARCACSLYNRLVADAASARVV